MPSSVRFTEHLDWPESSRTREYNDPVYMEPRQPFSERMRLVPVVVQTDGMDTELTNSIWNFTSRLSPAGNAE